MGLVVEPMITYFVWLDTRVTHTDVTRYRTGSGIIKQTSVWETVNARNLITLHFLQANTSSMLHQRELELLVA